MKIGELAAQSGTGIDAIRFYEREGLLASAQRSASGYRQFDADALRRLRFIRRAKALGFSLEEIAELLSLSTHDEADMQPLAQAVDAKLHDIDRRIAELTRMRAALAGLREAYPGHGALDDCPILAALSGDRP